MYYAYILLESLFRYVGKYNISWTLGLMMNPDLWDLLCIVWVINLCAPPPPTMVMNPMYIWYGPTLSMMLPIYTLESWRLESEINLFETEHHLNQTLIFGFNMWIFRGAIFQPRTVLIFMPGLRFTFGCSTARGTGGGMGWRRTFFGGTDLST